MNLSAVGAGSRTVEAFVSEIKEDADPACHCYPSRPRQRASADTNIDEAPVNLLDHRHVNRTHSSVAAVSQYTYPAHDAPRRASGARHPEPVSVLIHTV
jgi:hypothetical protein